MAGKSIDNRAPISIDTLKERVQEKYESHLFEHPEGYGVVELARLKRQERAAIQAATRLPGGLTDLELQNRMAAAFGLVNPKVTAEELKEYPDDFIEPIAKWVWDTSNAYQERLIAQNGTGDGKAPAPFFTKSSHASDSPSPSEKPSATSTP
jgi:hypothetical protein